MRSVERFRGAMKLMTRADEALESCGWEAGCAVRADREVQYVAVAEIVQAARSRAS